MGWEYYRQVERWILQMEMRDWVWVFVAVFVIGLIWMRTVGSRLG